MWRLVDDTRKCISQLVKLSLVLQTKTNSKKCMTCVCMCLENDT